MKTQVIKNILRLQEWASLIKEQNNSGQTIREWCKEQGLAVKTYYYRRDRVREAIVDAAQTNGELVDIIDKHPQVGSIRQATGPSKMEFAELAMPHNKSAITVNINGYVTNIHNGAENEIINYVLTTLARL
ncbi:MAG: hypothetical protein LBD23_07545 [Oscillospiraceae bacterium]|jgi:hypothetical protein|nr:hypothetical protein [Oscillospiraceae bacterium]